MISNLAHTYAQTSHLFLFFFSHLFLIKNSCDFFRKIILGTKHPWSDRSIHMISPGMNPHPVIYVLVPSLAGAFLLCLHVLCRLVVHSPI